MGPIQTIQFVVTTYPLASAVLVIGGSVLGYFFPKIPATIVGIFKKKETPTE